MQSLTELSLEEITSVNGGCSSIYDCAKAAGKWVANRLEDAVESLGDTGGMGDGTDGPNAAGEQDGCHNQCNY